MLLILVSALHHWLGQLQLNSAMAAHSLELSVPTHVTLAVHDSALLEAAQSVTSNLLIPTVNLRHSLDRVTLHTVAYSSVPCQADAPNLLD